VVTDFDDANYGWTGPHTALRQLDPHAKVIAVSGLGFSGKTRRGEHPERARIFDQARTLRSNC